VLVVTSSWLASEGTPQAAPGGERKASREDEASPSRYAGPAGWGAAAEGEEGRRTGAGAEDRTHCSSANAWIVRGRRGRDGASLPGPQALGLLRPPGRPPASCRHRSTPARAPARSSTCCGPRALPAGRFRTPLCDRPKPGRSHPATIPKLMNSATFCSSSPSPRATQKVLNPSSRADHTE
jgi:hypothetical protein